MRQTPYISLLFFALLAFSCFPLFGGTSLRSTSMTPSGIVELKKDTSSATNFYVEAEFSSSSSDMTSDNVRMSVVISNAETMVATNCLFFSSYDCSKYGCKNESKTTTIDFPTFTANVSFSKGHIRLNDTDWNLDSALLYIADSCQSGDTWSEIGTNRYGVLGLGSQNSRIFSFVIDPYQTSGKLLFKKDSKYAQSSLLYTLSANSTWQFPAENGSIQVENSSVSFNGNVMFDVNSAAIGLPSSIYKSFVNYFGNLNDVDCQIRDYKPKCNTTRQLKDLPDIILSVNGHQIKIPSKIYTTLLGDTRYFLLNFKATSPSFTAYSYISPSFKDSIVLDSNFMSYYYTVFDASSGSNVIYLYSFTETPLQPSKAKWIVLGVIAVFLLMSVIYFCLKKKKSTNPALDSFNTNHTPNATEYIPPIPVQEGAEQ